jgi:hypothetical protein
LIKHIQLVGESGGDIRLDYSAGTRDIKSATTTNFWNFQILNYASASTYKTFQGGGYFINSTSNGVTFMEAGAYRSNTAITSLVLTAGGSTFNAGTVKVYGDK